MTVVAAFELDDQVAAGHRPHQVDGIHGRLGAAVPKAPQGQPVSLGEVRGHHHGVVDRLGEVGAEGDPFGHRLDDGRMGMAGQHRSVTTVVVDVLVSVDVEDP